MVMVVHLKIASEKKVREGEKVDERDERSQMKLVVEVNKDMEHNAEISNKI